METAKKILIPAGLTILGLAILSFINKGDDK
jgi:hypothetical protein